jgi:hypothetical protein
MAQHRSEPGAESSFWMGAAELLVQPLLITLAE